MTELINGIRGWHFDQETLSEASREGRMLTMDFELGAACPLRCVYCYRTDDHRDYEKGLLDFDQWKQVVDDARDLGVESMKLIGGGEITEEPNFMEAMEYIAKRGIAIVLFTSGRILGDEDICQRLCGMSCAALAKWMCDLGMSIFLKVDSFAPDLQDRLVGKAGYAKARDRAFTVLLEHDFNKCNPTRLGLEVNVSRHNLHEIMDIYALRAKHNIYEDVVISMPCDAYYRNRDYDISLEEKRELYRKVYSFNLQNGIPFDRPSPFIGGLDCTQLGNGLYVTNRGDVYHCPGSFDVLGNVKTKPLPEIWKVFAETTVRYQSSYFCPFREVAKIIPSELVEEMTRDICRSTRSPA